MRIESMSLFRLVGPMHAIAVVLPRPQAGDVDVPDLIGSFFDADSMRFRIGVRPVEEAELDCGGIF
jgi:hypothetical protein